MEVPVQKVADIGGSSFRDMASSEKLSSESLSKLFLRELASLGKQSSESFANVRISWDLVITEYAGLFPHSCPNSLSDGKKGDSGTAAEFFRPMLSEVPEYHDDIKEVPQISRNKPIDVVSLLSGSAGSVKRDFLFNKKGELVPIKSLKGKYLLICSVLIPVYSQSLEGSSCKAMIAFHSELSGKHKENFRLVIVPKFKTAKNPIVVHFLKSFLDHFFSAFPDDCLVTPMWDCYACDYVFKSINLTRKGGLAALLIDPEGMVLQTSSTPSILKSHGAAAYPFSESHLEDCQIKDEILRLRLDSIYKEHNRAYLELVVRDDLDKLSSTPVSLEELLECQSLFNIEDEEEVVPVSDFSDKLVGLYLFYDGQFLVELGEVQEECSDEDRSFEIVLVCVNNEHDPSSVLKHLKSTLEENDILACDWWTFPFNYTICQKLWRLCNRDLMDKLIILPPPGDKYKSGDLQGKAVIREFDGFSAYPFTRKTILESRLSHFSSLTLESLLKEYDHFVCKKDGSSLTVADLQGKHILLYFDYYAKQDLYDEVCASYLGMRAKFPGSDVVFVPLNEASDDLKSNLVAKMPWLILPFFSPFVKEQLFLNGHPCCVAFGKDGRVRSRKAHWRLGQYFRLFDDHLREEIVAELHALQDDED